MNAAITSSQRRALRALSIAYFVHATGALSVAGSLPAISAAWQLTDAQSARLLSIFGLTFALAAPLVQVMFGHLRRRQLVLTGIGLFGLGAFAFALSPAYAALVASRILMGVGAGFIGPVLVALGSELVHEQQRGRAIGMVLLGYRWRAWLVFHSPRGSPACGGQSPVCAGRTGKPAERAECPAGGAG